MKMKWFDRVLLTLVLIIFIGIAIFAIGIALGVLGAPFIRFYNLMTNGVWVNSLILASVGAIMVLIAIRVLYASYAHRGAPPAASTVLLKTTDNGSIRIAVSAIDTMVQRSARSLGSVRDVASRILVDEHDALSVQLRVTFAPDTVLTEATAQIQNEVKEYVQTHSGVPVKDVQVFVEALGSNQPSRVD
jgi:uncharacterized alkaline shock family protein YloU